MFRTLNLTALDVTEQLLKQIEGELDPRDQQLVQGQLRVDQHRQGLLCRHLLSSDKDLSLVKQDLKEDQCQVQCQQDLKQDHL